MDRSPLTSIKSHNRMPTPSYSIPSSTLPHRGFSLYWRKSSPNTADTPDYHLRYSEHNFRTIKSMPQIRNSRLSPALLRYSTLSLALLKHISHNKNSKLSQALHTHTSYHNHASQKKQHKSNPFNPSYFNNHCRVRYFEGTIYPRYIETRTSPQTVYEPSQSPS